MATKKVGVYRSYRGPVPLDGETGRPLPKRLWPQKRPHSWTVRWFNTKGQRYSQSFPTRKEAEQFQERKQAEVRQGGGDPLPRCTLLKFAEDHKKLSGGTVRRTTLLRHMTRLRLFAEVVGWNCDLREIRGRHVEAFRARRAAEGLAVQTLNGDLRDLRRLFNLAIRREYLLKGGNPCDGIEFQKVSQKRPRYLSPEQFERLYQQAGNLLNRTLLVVLYTTAMRKGEALNLTWDDVDFDQQTVHVARKDVRKDAAGAGSPGRYVQPWEPKDHERREIPMPDQTISLLRELKTSAPKGCPYVFMDQVRWDYYRGRVDAGKWRSETSHLINNALRKFKTMCKRAKLSGFTMHDLRRSCITNWARGGLAIHVVQHLAGHADIKTTQQFYLSVQADDLRAARAAQQQIVGSLANVEVVERGGKSQENAASKSRPDRPAPSTLRGATDQKMTISPDVRGNLKRRTFVDGTQLPDEKHVA